MLQFQTNGSLESINLRAHDAAISMVGTPYLHQGRLPGVALDCIGLVSEAYRMAGYPHQIPADYRRIPDVRVLSQYVNKYCIKKDKADIGDIILIRFSIDPQHFAIMSYGNKIIHAYNQAKKVVIDNYSEEWIKKTVGIFGVKE